MGYARLQMTKKFYGGIFIDRQKLSSEGINYPIKIEYYKICDDSENKEKIQYRLEVVKTEYIKEKINIENETVLKVTADEKIINNILDKLKLNEVTPVVTRYVLEDMQCNY